MTDTAPPCPVCNAPLGACRGHDPGLLPKRRLFWEWEDPSRAATELEEADMSSGNSFTMPNPPPLFLHDKSEALRVCVHEQVWERIQVSDTLSTTVLKYNPGDWITVEEAKRLDVPLLDQHRQPVEDEPEPEPETAAQATRPPLETQQRPGPAAKRRR